VNHRVIESAPGKGHVLKHGGSQVGRIVLSTIDLARKRGALAKRPCPPRLTRCADGPASRSARQWPRGQRSCPNQGPHGAPGGTDQRRKNTTWPGKGKRPEVRRDRGYSRGCSVCATIRSERVAAAEGMKETRKETVFEFTGERDEEGHYSGGSPQTLTTGSLFSLGPTDRHRLLWGC
jgi:hypothetical protein